MSDRTINFGESETEATYQIQDTDSTGGGNFVVAKDTNANTVLLQYDPAADTWEYAGDVDMNGGNVSGVGTLTADSVNTEQATVAGSPASTYLTDNDVSDLNFFSGDEFQAEAFSFETFYDVTTPENIISAAVWGPNCHVIRATFEDSEGNQTTKDVTANSARRGLDDAGNKIMLVQSPPLHRVVELEFRNESADPELYGYEVISR